MTALSESFSFMIIHDVFSLPISTYLLFSQIGKPILDRLYVCMRDDMLKGEHVPPHVLPCTYMHTQLEMMQTACVHEGGHVER